LRLDAKPSGRLVVSLKVVGDEGLPSKVSQNVASAVAQAIGRAKGIRADLSITLYKGVRPGVGLGSSAASAVAATVAMDSVFNLSLEEEEAIRFSGEGERVATGSRHYDNASASLLGGFVVVGKGGENPVSFPPPRSLKLCLATPDLKLPVRKTEFARSLLPKEVSLRDMVHNVAMASHILSGFAIGDTKRIGYGMNDRVVEQARKVLVPGYDLVREGALEAGAAGVCISGAGPTMLAAVDSGKARPKNILAAMISGFKTAGVRSTGFVTNVGEGARVVVKR
jgi:homoserine kinase